LQAAPIGWRIRDHTKRSRPPKSRNVYGFGDDVNNYDDYAANSDIGGIGDGDTDSDVRFRTTALSHALHKYG
jgi:hypothetical protein